MSTPKKKTPRRQYDILRGMEIAENEPAGNAPEMHKEMTVEAMEKWQARYRDELLGTPVLDDRQAPVEPPADPWEEYRALEASRNQSDILLAILHELVRLRSAR